LFCVSCSSPIGAVTTSASSTYSLPTAKAAIPSSEISRIEKTTTDPLLSARAPPAAT
jgi:hypothetical protein